ncbi:palmitoyltransferase for Vac8p [Mortierella sp. GBA39]|nr:palmitoyltransferase for Vac8p [Mortierella sp. GBA39]
MYFLFFISYALSIFCPPRSPANPRSQTSQPTIPPTTTPYQLQKSPSVNSHISENFHPLPSSSPQHQQQNDSPPQSQHRRPRTSSTTTGQSTSSHLPVPSNIQRASPHLVAIVTAPKYPSAAVAPAASTSDLTSSRDINHIGIIIPSEIHVLEPTHTTHSIGYSASHSGSSGVGAVRVSIDNPGPMQRSRHASDESGTQQPLATLSISKRNGSPRWCNVCKIVKPDRCHHCSECNCCVLRMDHHCPWVNGCIGFDNYKYFYLFIFYGSLASLWVVGSMIPMLLQALQGYGPDDQPWNKVNSTISSAASSVDEPFNSDDGNLRRPFDVQWIIITVVAFLLALLIVSFTGAHTSYILNNRTTIESMQDVRNTFVRVQYRKKDPEPDAAATSGTVGPSVPSPRAGTLPSFMSEIEFNVVMVEQGESLWNQGSWIANWKYFMGPTWWLWFIPYFNTPGDGIHDIYSEKVHMRLVGDALAQARMQVVNSGGLTRDAGDNGCGGENEGDTSAGAGATPPTTTSGDSREPSTTAVPPSIDTTAHKTESFKGTLLPPSVRIGADQPDSKTGAASNQSWSQRGSDIEMQIHGNSPAGEGSRDRSNTTRSKSQSGQTSGYTTPTRGQSGPSPSPRQRSPKPSRGQSQSQSSSSGRRRQRTKSGGTSGSYSGYGGSHVREFGLGLGMDGIPVDSGTGLKLSSGHLGRSSHRSQARQHLGVNHQS